MAARNMTRMSGDPSEVRAVIYLRISMDPGQTGLANERQRNDCLRIIRERGWGLAREYSDTESASDRRKRRPGYEAMLKDYEAGRFDALVCWDLDRLTRQPRQLEDWIDLADGQGLRLVTANGEADLQTDGGRMYARIKAAVAKAEVERKAARQRAQARQAAEMGKHAWTNRPFGYGKDGTLLEDEAAAIAQGYRDVLNGTTPTEVARRWQAAGFKPLLGANRWTGARVTDVLKSRRNIAQSTYKGEVVGAAQWPAIVDLETWEGVQAVLARPGRGGNHTPRSGRVGNAPTTLLSGIATCAVCGDGVVRTRGGIRNDGSRNVIYSCHPGHATANLAWLDSAVFAVFYSALLNAREVWPGAGDGDQGERLNSMRAELATIEGKLSELAEAYAADILTLAQMTAATAKLRQREEDVRAQLSDLSDTPTLERMLAPGGLEALVDVWHKLDLGQQRQAISSVFSKIEIYPRGRRGKGKIPTIGFETTRPLPGFPCKIVGLSEMTPEQTLQVSEHFAKSVVEGIHGDVAWQELLERAREAAESQ